MTWKLFTVVLTSISFQHLKQVYFEQIDARVIRLGFSLMKKRLFMPEFISGRIWDNSEGTWPSVQSRTKMVGSKLCPQNHSNMLLWHIHLCQLVQGGIPLSLEGENKDISYRKVHLHHLIRWSTMSMQISIPLNTYHQKNYNFFAIWRIIKWLQNNNFPIQEFFSLLNWWARGMLNTKS